MMEYAATWDKEVSLESDAAVPPIQESDIAHQEALHIFQYVRPMHSAAPTKDPKGQCLIQ